MTNSKNRIILYIITGLVIVLVIGAVVLMTPGTPAESVAELLSLGNRFLSELNYEQALVQFLRVIEIEPRNAQGYYGAARAYIGLGRIDEAIDILRRGIEMTGDAQLQALLEELTGGGTGAHTAGNGGTEATPANVREAVPAPFTASEIAQLDEIVETMLAGNYEGAAALLESSAEIFDSIRETHATHNFSFIYRDIFAFTIFPFYSHFDTVEVIMYNVYEGAGSYAEIGLRLEHRPIWGRAGETVTAWRIRTLQIRDGQANGIYEVRQFYDGELSFSNTAPLVNGLKHGEHVITHIRLGDPTINTEMYAYGFLQPTGPPNAEGHIPVGTTFYNRRGTPAESVRYTRADDIRFSEPDRYYFFENLNSWFINVSVPRFK